MKRLFGEFNISWKFLLLFSIIIGLLVGILNDIPFLNDTSFQDIAIWLDMWFILAIFIIINTHSWKEAVLKCFVFFLISQPLIYLVEILIETVFMNGNFKELFILYFKNYYIGAGWFRNTLLTIPGAFIAYQIKRNNVLSAIILSVATGYLSCVGITGLLKTLFYHFPYHLINSLICLVMAFWLIFLVLTNKKERIIAFILTLIGLFIGIYDYNNYTMQPVNAYQNIYFNDNLNIVEVVSKDNNIINALLDESKKYMFVSSSTKVGSTTIEVTDINGKIYVYDVKIDSKKLSINLINN